MFPKHHCLNPQSLAERPLGKRFFENRVKELQKLFSLRFNSREKACNCASVGEDPFVPKCLILTFDLQFAKNS
jgi:hypothetical protein